MAKAAALILVVLTAAGCAYHAPDAPTPVTAPPPNSAPASIRLAAASRADQAVDVTATVLTADGHFVANVAVSFTASAGTLAPAAATTDANGAARVVLANAGNAVVGASAGAIQASLGVLGSIATPPVTPGPGPTPTPTPTPSTPTAILNVATNGTVGASLAFGVSAPALGQTWTWTFGDGASAQTTAFSTGHTYTAPGSYTATVAAPGIVAGHALITITDPIVVTPAPVSSFVATLNCTAAAHGSPTGCNVTATYNGTTVPSASFTSVAWDFGDGATTVTSTPVVTRTYAVAGSYTVIANVNAGTFDGPKSATVTKTLTIQ